MVEGSIRAVSWSSSFNSRLVESLARSTRSESVGIQHTSRKLIYKTEIGEDLNE